MQYDQHAGVPTVARSHTANRDCGPRYDDLCLPTFSRIVPAAAAFYLLHSPAHLPSIPIPYLTKWLQLCD
jgi:hypothetical protein